MTAAYLLTEGDGDNGALVSVEEFLDDGGEVFNAETREKIRTLAPGEEYRSDDDGLDGWCIRHLTEQELRAFESEVRS